MTAALPKHGFLSVSMDSRLRGNDVAMRYAAMRYAAMRRGGNANDGANE
jgi:hypothetical protein